MMMLDDYYKLVEINPFYKDESGLVEILEIYTDYLSNKYPDFSSIKYIYFNVIICHCFELGNSSLTIQSRDNLDSIDLYRMDDGKYHSKVTTIYNIEDLCDCIETWFLEVK